MKNKQEKSDPSIVAKRPANKPCSGKWLYLEETNERSARKLVPNGGSISIPASSLPGGRAFDRGCTARIPLDAADVFQQRRDRFHRRPGSHSLRTQEISHACQKTMHVKAIDQADAIGRSDRRR
jgi:hypothetical protein